MRIFSFIGFTFIFLLVCVCGEPTLTYSCKNASNTVNVTLNSDAGNQFIIVPSCNDSNGVGNMLTLSHCSESFMNGAYPGYLFHETGHISEVRRFTINCKNQSNGSANVSDILSNITINTLPPQYICDFNLTIEDGNKGYYLGQEMKISLTAAGPYSIAPVKCIASSSANPNISFVLWENGNTNAGTQRG
ncbi:hypothetical protein CHS0354_016154 [Potamilus streckersoni]|uniref:Uncharacterized protein n=1 Tax=Potamilus streckersoni TaxID=2493646 RepID=A0AAE0SQ91_9BIVA|nr:hypothetical protein CHS0354_016154 [Potamilus streckersoni]